MQFHAVLSEDVADSAQVLCRKAVVRQRLGRCAEDLRKVDNGVTCDRKSKLGLFLTSAFDTYDRESARVQNRSERSNPGLVVVLRAKIGQHGIAEMAFHQEHAPHLPLIQDDSKGFRSTSLTHAEKQYGGD